MITLLMIVFTELYSNHTVHTMQIIEDKKLIEMSVFFDLVICIISHEIALCKATL